MMAKAEPRLYRRQSVLSHGTGRPGPSCPASTITAPRLAASGLPITGTHALGMRAVRLFLAKRALFRTARMPSGWQGSQAGTSGPAAAGVMGQGSLTVLTPPASGQLPTFPTVKAAALRASNTYANINKLGPPPAAITGHISTTDFTRYHPRADPRRTHTMPRAACSAAPVLFQLAHVSSTRSMAGRT